MAYDPGAIDATLAAAVGDEPALIGELRIAFIESAEQAIAAIAAAKQPDDWSRGAARLKGLAASFGAVRLMAMAGQLAERPGDADLLAKARRAVARL